MGQLRKGLRVDLGSKLCDYLHKTHKQRKSKVDSGYVKFVCMLAERCVKPLTGVDQHFVRAASGPLLDTVQHVAVRLLQCTASIIAQ